MKVFDYLLKPLGTGHHIYADRYYTTRKLIDHLISCKMDYTGTVNTNRKGIPPPIKQKTLTLAHREHKSFLNADSSILCVAWRDKKAKKYVVVASTSATTEQCQVNRRLGAVEMPSVINSYNHNMNGCDRVDQSLSYYGQYSRKTIKWWKRIFLWILEVSQVNSHILYTLTRTPDEKKLPLLNFKQVLLKQLTECGMALQIANNELPPRMSERGRKRKVEIERLSQKKHLVQYSPVDRNCVVCSTPTARARTKYQCGTCSIKPYLHPKECFYKYHTQLNYKVCAQKMILIRNIYISLHIYCIIYMYLYLWLSDTFIFSDSY